MKYIIAYILIIFSLSAPGLRAQDVEFRASAKNVVQQGERFQLVFSLNASGSNFNPPDLSNFRLIAGPSPSTSYSTQNINGRVSQSINQSYTYYLQALKEGSFKIPPARITANGKVYESNPISIRVVKGNQRQAGQQQGNASGGNNEILGGDDIFLRAIVDKKNPYLGEQVLVTYNIYTRVAARSPTVKEYPSFPGFWSVDLTDASKQMQQRREILNGEQYVTAVISQVALFPQKSGELSIEPMQVDVQVQVQTQSRRSRTGDSFFDRFFDDPFFNNIQYVDKNLVTAPVKINVKPLPLSNRPASFDGAIGNFSLRYDLDKTETNTNEPLTYKITISGNGNLELIDNLDVNFPPDFEVYDPKKTSNIRKNENGVSGTISFEYLIIPRVEGEFIIDPVKFSYFDISEEKYKSLSTPEYTIKVNKGEESYSNVSYSGVSQQDVKYIGSDIRHIKTGNIQLQKIGSHFFDSLNFYLMIIIPLTLALIFVIGWKTREKKRKDIGLMNYKRATRVARKNLKKARQFMKEGKEEAFFVEISQALWGYLSNKFNIPRAKLSIENVHQVLSRQEIKKENIDQFTETLNHTEYARFAPGSKEENREKIYNEALEIISKIERELR